jgi:nucleosome binding factor SPN SPT16 subunit
MKLAVFPFRGVVVGSWQERVKHEEEVRQLFNEILHELKCARHNVGDCPEHKQDEPYIGELEHADMHIENAIGLVNRLKNLLQIKD